MCPVYDSEVARLNEILTTVAPDIATARHPYGDAEFRLERRSDPEFEASVGLRRMVTMVIATVWAKLTTQPATLSAVFVDRVATTEEAEGGYPEAALAVGRHHVVIAWAGLQRFVFPRWPMEGRVVFAVAQAAAAVIAQRRDDNGGGGVPVDPLEEALDLVRAVYGPDGDTLVADAADHAPHEVARVQAQWAAENRPTHAQSRYARFAALRPGTSAYDGWHATNW